MNSFEPAPILLMVRSLDLGGSERQMAEVAKSIDRTRFAPHVGTFHPEGIRGDELRAAGVPILHLPVTSFASPSALRGGLELIRYIRRHKIRMVHTFDVPLNVFAVPFARLAHLPVVLSSQRAHRNLTPGLYTQLLRITDAMVDGIVVNCLHMRDHLISDERFRPELIHLCYNGIDTGVFHPFAPEGEKPFPLSGAGTVIGVVCALRPEKGLSSLLDAFSRIARLYSGVTLAVVGSGPCLPDLLAQSDRLGIRDQCVFAPTTNNVAPWLRAFDIFVLPSLSEALSNSLMEAMACGCCCVASAVGGNPELIGQDRRGVLFPTGDSSALADALEVLLSQPGLQRSYSAAALSFITNQFSRESSIRRMSAIYSSFLEGELRAASPSLKIQYQEQGITYDE
ncbi:MAG: glycosyltransferase [Acidobacteriota bacterium]|nr:glycosyltransferase [Acidobacteriota bacterium]